MPVEKSQLSRLRRHLEMRRVAKETYCFEENIELY